jgi:hypothetical protein
MQTALTTIMHLAEGLALAQSWASNTEWNLIIFVGTRRLTVLKVEGQVILLLNAMITNRAPMFCYLD